MADRVFNWCFIGTGNLGQTVAKAILPSGRHRIVTAYSRNRERLEAYCAEFGARPCASASEAMTDPAVDGVYIVTPHSSHYAYAKEALETGKPVLLEKAFTVSAWETEELIRLADEKKLYLAEAMWTWYSPLARKALEWVSAGKLGRIQSGEIRFVTKLERWGGRLTDVDTAGGALLDLGVYPLTYAYRLFGIPESIRCRGVLANGIDVSETMELTYPDNLKVICESAFDKPFNGDMVIRGTEGTLSAEYFHMTNRVRLDYADGRSEVFEGDGGYLNEFDRVAEEILAGRTESAYVPHKATLDVMRIMDECRRQMGLKYPWEA